VCLARGLFLSLGRKNLLDAHLVDEVFSTQISQVSTLLIICQVRANSIDHDGHQSAIRHIEPVRAANEFASVVTDEWAIEFGGEVRFVETGQCRCLSYVGVNSITC